MTSRPTARVCVPCQAATPGLIASADDMNDRTPEQWVKERFLLK